MTAAHNRKSWLIFVLGVMTIKTVFLILDPTPRLVLGDSGSYILTAVEGVIPEDRSFTYGYLIRLATLFAETLTPLLGLQIMASAASAILLAYALRRYCNVMPPLAFVFGLTCALEPIQLLYERYVMAETFSLFCFVLYLLLILRYLQHPRLHTLCLVQLCGTLVFSLRLSLLPVVVVNAVCVPLLAAWQGVRPIVNGSLQRLWRCAGIALVPLLVSLFTMFVFHHAYKQVYAALSGQPPGYHAADGFMLAALWAPIIEPIDLPLPSLRTQVFEHLAYDLKDRALRSNQLFEHDGLIDKLRKALPTPAAANRFAKVMALHAARRNPLGVFRLAWETFLDYFRLTAIQGSINNDLAIDAGQIELYQLYYEWYGQYYRLPYQEEQPLTLTGQYYRAAIPWYWVLLWTPLLWLPCLLTVNNPTRVYLTTLLIACVVCITTATALAPFPIVRYLHPVAWLAFFPIAVLCNSAFQSGRLLTVWYSHSQALTLPASFESR